MGNELTWWAVKRAGTHAVLKIFEHIGSAESAAELGAALDGAETVELWIDSPGGNAGAADKIFDMLSGKCTVATVTRRAFSAASLIITAAKTIRIYSNAQIMIHSATTGCVGDADDLRLAADSLAPFNESQVSHICKRSGLPVETVRGWVSGGRDNYFDAEQSLALGLADEIIERPTLQPVEPVADTAGDEPAAAQTESEKLFLDLLRAFGRVEVADKEKFTRELSAWLACNVNEQFCG